MLRIRPTEHVSRKAAERSRPPLSLWGVCELTFSLPSRQILGHVPRGNRLKNLKAPFLRRIIGGGPLNLATGLTRQTRFRLIAERNGLGVELDSDLEVQGLTDTLQQFNGVSVVVCVLDSGDYALSRSDKFCEFLLSKTGRLATSQSCDAMYASKAASSTRCTRAGSFASFWRITSPKFVVFGILQFPSCKMLLRRLPYTLLSP